MKLDLITEALNVYISGMAYTDNELINLKCRNATFNITASDTYTISSLNFADSTNLKKSIYHC